MKHLNLIHFNPYRVLENGQDTAPPQQKLSTQTLWKDESHKHCPHQDVEWLIGFPKHTKLKKEQIACWSVVLQHKKQDFWLLISRQHQE
jgi:hypothetical protein